MGSCPCKGKHRPWALFAHLHLLSTSALTVVKLMQGNPAGADQQGISPKN